MTASEALRLDPGFDQARNNLKSVLSRPIVDETRHFRIDWI